MNSQHGVNSNPPKATQSDKELDRILTGEIFMKWQAYDESDQAFLDIIYKAKASLQHLIAEETNTARIKDCESLIEAYKTLPHPDFAIMLNEALATLKANKENKG